MSITDQELNSIKEKISKAYVYTILSKLNFVLHETSRDMDGLGIDFEVINRTVGLNRTIASIINQINLQIKGVSTSSKSMFKEDNKVIEYNLTRALNPIGNFYIIIVQLLDEDSIDKWVEHNPDKLIIRKCAYFLKVEKQLKSGFIKIPKTNVFKPDVLPSLFPNS